MRTKPTTRFIRFGFAIALMATACAEDEAPPTGLLADYASGVDAEFGVEAFALGEPALTITSPQPKAGIAPAVGDKADIVISFTVANFTLGTGKELNCYLNGAFHGATVSSPYKMSAVAKGAQSLRCVLADAGKELKNKEAEARFWVQIQPKCVGSGECDDGRWCSTEGCNGGTCVYNLTQGCCGSNFDCDIGAVCNDPESAKAQCAFCKANTDCDDKEVCTTDVCDLSGTVGQCVNSKQDLECCSKADDPCNDGKSCTVDSCDVASGKCKHVKPLGACCADSECVPSSPCLAGQCVENECRFGPDVFRQDCCDTQNGINPTCNDGYICTTDACDQPQPGNWTKCSHVVPQDKIGVCCTMSTSTNECDDGNTCTLDQCLNFKCVNTQVADCCFKDNECNDSNTCSVDNCVKDPADLEAAKAKGIAEDKVQGLCKFDKTPGCCESVNDCDDGLFCTVNECDLAQKKCVYSKISPFCCDSDQDCDDSVTCNTDVCVNHGCTHGPDLTKPGCCNKNADCDDLNACTFNLCNLKNSQEGLCEYISNGDPTCCNDAADCDDSDCTTLDFCDSANKCAYKPSPIHCKTGIDCDDGLACTIDACDVKDGCGSCTHTAAKDCCNKDFECNDDLPCTIDTCGQDNKCAHESKSGCCLDDKDAISKCDDNNGCTIEYCVNNSCRHTVPKDACCTKDAECTASACEIGSCTNIDAGTGKGTCAFKKDDTCVCAGLTEATDCDDSNPCTIDKCLNDTSCVHTAKQGCCLDKFDCSDGDACTHDVCVFNECLNYENLGGLEKLCCAKETENVDCAGLNGDCAVGKCLDQPDGTRSCVAVPKPVCTFEIGYCQDFASQSNLALMGWNPTDLKGTAKTNWKVETSGGLGPDQHARFDWTPVKLNYDSCLQSPIFKAAGADTITLQFDREFVKNTGDSGIRILGSLDGENVDWTKATLVDTFQTNSNFGPETVDVVLPQSLSGSNGLRLAVCVSGASSFNLTRFSMDNFCAAKGSAPKINCPPNQIAEVGQITQVPIKAQDPDLDAILSFSLEKAPGFASVGSAIYFFLDNSWNSTLKLNPSLDDVGEHDITIKVTDGHLYRLCTLKVTITYQGGVVVWKPTKIPAAHADVTRSMIKQAGKFVQVIDDISIYSDYSKFDAVFVLLGVYPKNHVLKETEVKALKLYLAGGGRVYMEGGDTWVFDSPTSLHSDFKIEGILDESPNGITGPLKGFKVYGDVNGSYQWKYNQNVLFNSGNDQIQGKTDVKRTGNILRNDGLEKFWVHVGHDNPTAKYRTIGSSILFAGIEQDKHTPLDLMKKIFEFFDNGFKDCTKDADCDDGNGCTADKCDTNAGECSSTNTCLCSAQSALTCGQKATKLVTNGGAATHVTTTYKCDPTKLYEGKEIAYEFVNAKSGPVTIYLTNVNNANARVFVLKSTVKGCDPDGCVAASTTIASGKTQVAFPAAKDIKYYIVVDVPAKDGAATFDIELSCDDGEICDDGLDNNNNQLIDCNDWASCCGDPACTEVCDGIDNDCDLKVDETCDDDGDGYCNVKMKVTKSAKCSNTKLPVDDSTLDGDDCADENGTINPGATEVCGNNKDDDCDGLTDEEDSSGCTNYYKDLDSDDYGTGSPRCLCAPSGGFKAKQGGDCNDGNVDINPGKKEDCNTAFDDDCNGSDNDINAVDCANWYTDVDSDGWGTTPFKCLCKAEDNFKSNKPGDCDDNVQAVNPGIEEICNNLDDNCDGIVDNGCDNDGDDYCDTGMKYDKSAEPVLACPKGPGDTQDDDPAINPEGKEICDDKDNDSDGDTDEECDDDGDNYCDATMFTSGTPKVCPLGGADCDDTNAKINPGVKEDCNTAADDNCNGTNNDINALNSKPWFYDGDGDAWGRSDNERRCKAVGKFSALQPGDCKDDIAAINPGALEVCDDIDNDCDFIVDNGCDNDKDGYCNKGKQIVGTPKSCPSGGGDCDDFDAQVNPGKAEVCGNGKDDNCNGSENDVNAIGCVQLFADADNDGFGSPTSKCLCVVEGVFKVTNSQDCDDTRAKVNPSATEICNDRDDDCDKSTDEKCDDDGDGYCDKALGYDLEGKAALLTCPKGGGDCNDENSKVHPGLVEICNDVDTNCDGVVDDLCDQDKDGYCDAGKLVAVPAPKICTKGGGDCDDFNNDVNPAAPEVCGNKIDDNCNASQNDEDALGCTNFYFDGDGDKYGLNAVKCLCETAGKFTAIEGKDCNDADIKINPGATEICDAADNDCDGDVDEVGATGCTNYYYDNDLDGFGIDLIQCLCKAEKPYTASKKGDCNDNVKTVNPGATEVCDDSDNDCNSQVDDGCNDDGDKFCDENFTVIGTPNVCPLGGKDCDDEDAAVSPTGNEVCDDKDNDCDGVIDEGCNDDGDDYCDANFTTIGTPKVCIKGGGDCNDTVKAINPGALEICGNTVDENCTGSDNDVGAQGCKDFYVDKDKDGYGADSSGKKCICKPEGDYVGTQAGDCDDTNNLVNQGATEICDGVDNDCDNTKDEGCDDDGDGYCDSAMATIGKPPVCPNGGGDCKDLVKAINPGATEVCGDGIDNNCSGDETDAGGDQCTDYFWDGDGDGYGVSGVKQCLCVPQVGKGFNATSGGDCDDTKSAINPAATEVCGDGLDNNCNGLTNEVDASGCKDYYQDLDKDGYGAGTKRCQCVPEGSYITNLAGDCKDNDPTVNPGAEEICDGKDNTCTNSIDKGCDTDGDGYCDAGMKVAAGASATCPKTIVACAGVVYNGKCYQGFNTLKNWSNSATACQALGGELASIATAGENTAVTQAAAKVCGGTGSLIGLSDVATEGTYLWGDLTAFKYSNWAGGQPDNSNNQDAVEINPSTGAWNDVATSDLRCYVCKLGKPSQGLGDDCDDEKKPVNPGAIEVCDNLDNNCDGKADDGCDDDNDGYCDKNNGIVGTPTVCPNGGGDCDDSNNQVHPNKTEICDDFDNDCDNNVDNGCDDDKDGFCDSSKGTVGVPKICPKGFGDCNDDDNAINPDAEEKCDTVDNNCAGGVDEGCNDDDGDGYCKGAAPVSSNCPKGGGDCDDTNKAINPGAIEDCATKTDDNCNQKFNEVDAKNCKKFYEDADEDGFGTGAGVCQCFQKGLNTAIAGGDCDDKDATVNPNAQEICDGKDNDCKGLDSGCDDDKDGFCDASMLVSNPIPGTCPKGPGDCNDNDDKTYPSQETFSASDKIIISGLSNAHTGNLGGRAGADLKCQAEAAQYGHAGKWVAFLSTSDKSVKDLIPAPFNSSLKVYNTNGTQLFSSWNAIFSSGSGSWGGAGGYLKAFQGRDFNESTGASPDWSDADGWHGSNSNGTTYNGQTCNDWTTTGGSGVATELDSYQLLRIETGHSCSQYLGVICVMVGNTVKSGDGAAEICDGNDNDCDGQVDETCDADGDGYCAADAPMLFGNCCDAHGGAGCTDATIESCVTKIYTQCKTKWDKTCSNAVKQLGCNQCAFPAVCPNGGNDCADNNSKANPNAQEHCGTPNDDNCDGSLDEINATACQNWYVDADGDGYGTNEFQCRCAANGKFVATQAGDCDDTDPATNTGNSKEYCDGKDNNCNGTKDEGCDKDGDGYCDDGLIVLNNTACPKSLNSPAGCLDKAALVDPEGFAGRKLGLNQHSHGGGYNQALGEFWMPEYNSSYSTKIFRYKAGTYEPKGVFQTTQRYVRQAWIDPDGSHMYLATYYDGIRKIRISDNKLIWTSSPSSYLTAVACDATYCYTQRYTGSQVYVIRKDNGGYVKTKYLSGWYGCSNYGGLIVDEKAKKLYRLSTCRSMYRFDLNGTSGSYFYHDNMKVFTPRTPYASEWTGKEVCTSDTSGPTTCYTPPAAASFSRFTNSFSGGWNWGATMSHTGGTYSTKHQEFWMPYWSSGSVRRYNDNRQSKNTYFNISRSQIMGGAADESGNYYTAHYGYHEVRKHNVSSSGTGASHQWTRHTGHYNSSVGYWTRYYPAGIAWDSNKVYMGKYAYNTSRVYVMNESNGDILSHIDLQGCQYCGNTQYGAFAVQDGNVFKGTDSGWVEAFDLQTGSKVGAFVSGSANHGGYYDRKRKQMCTHNNGWQHFYCYDLTKMPVPKVRQIGMRTYYIGGGHHAFHKEYWYANYTSSNNTQIYVYDAATQQLKESFDSGQRYVRDLVGDLKEDAYYVATYYDGIRKLSKKTNQVLWSRQPTNYMSAVATDGDKVYAMHYSSQTVYVLNRATGNIDNTFSLTGDWNGGTTYGIIIANGQLYRTDTSRWVYGYDLKTGKHNGVKFTAEVTPYAVMYDPDRASHKMCVSDSSDNTYCYDLPKSGGGYVAEPKTMNTYSYGGGFHEFYNEYWYPQWTSGQTTVHRYNIDGVEIGTFNSGQAYIRQLAGDPQEDAYYTADYYEYRIKRRSGTSQTIDWNYYIGYYAGGVAVDNNYVYAMRYNTDRTVYKLAKKKQANQLVSTFQLGGDLTGNQYGIAARLGKLWRVSYSNRWVYRYDLATGQHDGVKFQTQTTPYNVSFTGTHICTSQNDSNVYCYKVVTNSCIEGNDCDDHNKLYNPGANEMCDDADNNCDGKIDDDCDKDKDGYCDSKLITIGLPAVCKNGGGDCGDTDPKLNPGAPEFCDNVDNNCNGAIDEAGAAGCTKYYFDGDGDGYGVTSNQCLCKPSGLFTAKSSNDCDDTCQTCYPGAPETCDDRDNDCGYTPMSGPKYVKQVNFNDYSHGGGYDAARGLYTYPAWAGRRVYLFDNQGKSKGFFDSGQDQIMQMWWDEKGDHYTANWGRGEVRKFTAQTAKPMWTYNMGGTVAAVTGDDKYIYAMRNTGNTVWVINQATGALVRTMGLGGGGGNFGQSMYGTLHYFAGHLYYSNGSDNWVYGYRASNGQFLNIRFPITQLSATHGSSFNGGQACYHMNGQQKHYCYTLPGADTDYTYTSHSMNTRSHGGGFVPFHNEFWYPQWSGTTVYRYDANMKYIGAFNAGRDQMMDITGDPNADFYYTANWGHNTVAKWSYDFKTNKNTHFWTFNIGSTAGGVAVDDKYVYAMRSSGSTVWVIDKDKGTQVKTMNLGTWPGGSMNGSLHVFAGHLYAGTTSRWIHRYDKTNGAFDGTRIYSMASDIYSSAFDGKRFCISPNSSTVYCYHITGKTILVDEGCDVDGDGYCDKNKVTVGTPKSCVKGGGDCNDGAKSINPGAIETCNNVDDNCNTKVDEGASSACDATALNAFSKCEAGQCKIVKCFDGYYNANGLLTDGCECTGADSNEPNNSWTQAVASTLTLQDNGMSQTFQGRVVDNTDRDWFKFYAQDNGDGGSNACDRYSVRVRFVKNPGGALRLNVYRGTPGGSNAFCCNDTDFNWGTWLKSYNKNYYSSGNSEFGECPCQSNNTFDSSRAGWHSGYNYDGYPGPYCMNHKGQAGECIPNGYYKTKCSNDSQWYYVEVFKGGSGDACSTYEIEMSNGVYSTPGHKGYSP